MRAAVVAGALAIAATARADVAIDLSGGPAWRVVGRSDYGTGEGVALRAAWLERTAGPTTAGLVGLAELVWMPVASGEHRRWLRIAAGVRASHRLGARWTIDGELLGGVSEYGDGPGYYGWLVMPTLGPRVALGRFVVGLDASLAIARFPTYDTDGGSYADPSGGGLELRLVLGARF